MDAINTGTIPCLENAVTTLAQLQNSAVVQKAVDHYSEQTTQWMSLPADTLQELLEVHVTCEREAIVIFMGVLLQGWPIEIPEEAHGTLS